MPAIRYALILALVPLILTGPPVMAQISGGEVDVPAGGRVEPTVAINPLDPNNIAVASNDINGQSLRISTDGGATFSVQAEALAGMDTLEAYTEWMKGILTPVPDGKYEVQAFAVDESRQKVIAYGVFRGTQTGEGGPIPPTGNKVETDYVYVMQFDGDKIRHMTKIWNDVVCLKQLGWM